MSDPRATWTIGGDFLIVDANDDDAPMAELRLYSPLKDMAIYSSLQSCRIAVVGSDGLFYLHPSLRDEGK